MAQRNREHTLNQATQRMLDRFQIQDHYLAWRLVQQWPSVAGPTLAAQTQEVRFVAGVLTLTVRNRLFRHEFEYRREEYRSLLNERLGKAIIQRIELRN